LKRIFIKASNEYEVLIGKGILDNVGEYLAKLKKPCRAAVVTDENVNKLYGVRVINSLESAGFSPFSVVIAPGESSKCLSVCEAVLDMFARGDLTGSDIVVALGGGVVGDLAGFCAAIYRRGMDFIQIPTTFLAAIDSSVGGKTGVDLASGKNLAGVFHQPRLVVCDTETFNTLSPDIFSEGTAEAIKYGLIADEALFEKISSGNFLSETDEIVSRCVDIKGGIVSRDEFDKGERRLLNLGHTFAHAIENLSEYKISHGAAVGMGLVLAAQTAVRKGLCEENLLDKTKEALKTILYLLARLIHFLKCFL